MGSAVWVLVVLAVTLIVIALLVFVVPLGRDRSATGRPRRSGSAAGPPSTTGALAHGLRYPPVSSPTRARRGGVHERLARAYARIDAVDPHATSRRVGEALVQALGEPTSPPAPRRPTWPSEAADPPGEVR